MTLEEINKRLIELISLIRERSDFLRNREYEYDMRYYDLFLRSGMGNAGAREAEAKTICDNEGLYVPYLDVKADVRSLLNEKEMLIEISKNMRALRITE